MSFRGFPTLCDLSLTLGAWRGTGISPQGNTEDFRLQDLPTGRTWPKSEGQGVARPHAAWAQPINPESFWTFL